MKEKYLIIEEFELHRSGAVTALLERLLEEEEVYLTIRWKFFSVRLNRSLLERIASLLYEQGVKKEFTVCCIVETAVEGSVPSSQSFEPVRFRSAAACIPIADGKKPEKDGTEDASGRTQDRGRRLRKPPQRV